jgi:hypothetical protein
MERFLHTPSTPSWRGAEAQRQFYHFIKQSKSKHILPIYIYIYVDTIKYYMMHYYISLIQKKCDTTQNYYFSGEAS